MKLRRRMLLFSTTQLVVFGVLFAVALGAFERAVLPMERRRRLPGRLMGLGLRK